MKHFYLLGILSSLSLTALARPALRLSAPLDTIAGQTKFVRQLSRAMCSRLSTDRTLALGSLTPPQAMTLTQELFVEAMKRDSVALMALMSEGARQHLSPQEVGQLIGKDAVIDLAKSCPASLPLLAQLGQTKQARDIATAKLPPVSAVEQKILLPVASDMCAKLTAANTKQPLAKRTPAQRQEVFVQAIQQEFTGKRAQLLRYYSAAQLADKEQVGEITKKICRLLIEQNYCADYLTLLGMDSLTTE